MKFTKFTIGALAMTLAATPSNSLNVITPDEAAIHTIVESVANLADRENFTSLEQLYAPEVKVDYTSAFGGEVELKSPQALMTQWASSLPGFDRTRHEISNIETEVQGNAATATADVVASHYLDEMFWQIEGSYEYGLVKEDGLWTIDKMTFIAGSEQGSRDIIGKAVEQATINPSTYVQQQQTKQAVIDLLTSLEDKDMDKFANLWAEDAVQDMPFSPEGCLGARSLASCAERRVAPASRRDFASERSCGSHRFPKRVEGKANLIEHYASWSEVSGEANFTDELVFYPMQDSTMVFAEWRGDVEIIPTGRQYQQQYGGLFHVVDGKIELFREYYDPIVFQYAFGLDES